MPRPGTPGGIRRRASALKSRRFIAQGDPDVLRSEPPRVCRRLFRLSQAAMAQVLQAGVVGGFGFGRRDVADRLEQAAVVEPVDPFERGVLDGFERAPRPAPMDHLGFVEAVDRLGERVVVAVADAADRRHETGLGQALGVLDRDVLHAAIGVVHEAAAGDGFAIMQRLLQRIEHEAGMRRPRHAPADDAAGVGVDDEGDVDEARARSRRR